MTYKFAFEKWDLGRIDKLNKLTNLDTYHDDVRKLTARIVSDHAIHRWEHLAEMRFNELLIMNGKEPEYGFEDYTLADF